MPRKSPVTDEQLISDLKNLYGTEISAGDIRGFCASRNMNYQTVTRRLESFKTTRGRWNLEVTQERVEEIERSYQAPAVLPAAEQNLIPDYVPAVGEVDACLKMPKPDGQKEDLGIT